jgi:hypothetical protein
LTDVLRIDEPIRVTVVAVGSSGVNRRKGERAAVKILKLSDRLEVPWIYTGTVPTEVV